MATDQWGFLVAKVAEQGQGVSDCSHPDRKSKRTTMMGDGGEGGNFQKPNYFWDGGEKNITVITAPGKSGVEEQEVMEKQWGCTEEVSQRKKKKVSQQIRQTPNGFWIHVQRIGLLITANFKICSIPQSLAVKF